jgi:peptidoglycan/LPS O-acetylase OafA/YrhL
LQGLALFPIFVAAIRFPDWGPFRILNTRVLAYLGVLSYGMYLVHEIALRYLGPGGAFRGAAALALTIAAAAIMHRFVERPLARFRQRRPSPPAHSDRADAEVSGQ